MKLHYNVTKGRRKELANAISEIIGQEVNYKGIPSYEYVIGEYIVDKDGTLTMPDTDPEMEKTLVERLENQYGFKADSDLTAPNPEVPSEKGGEEQSQSDDDATPENNSAESEPDGFEKNLIILSLPRKNFSSGSIERLKAITASKQTLLKKALDTNVLDIHVTEDQVVFPWFTDHGWDGEIDAYSKLICAMANMAIRQKRVTAVEQPCFDEKRSMRLFLIRLNFIGEEYRVAREILTRNFTNGEVKNSCTEFTGSEILVNGIPMTEATKEDTEETDEEDTDDADESAVS